MQKQRLSPAHLFRWLAGLFALLLIGIILLANRGLINIYFGFLYDFPYGDQIGHFILLGTLSLLLALGFANTRLRLGWFTILRTSLILAGLMTLEEISQWFNPNRTFSLLDLAANYAGIFLLGELGAWLKRALPQPR